MQRISRRDALSQSGRLLGVAAFGLPLVETKGGAQPGGVQEPNKKLKVIVAGAHPDDPESGAGGTAARYSDLGHEVVIIYLTRGEAGIEGKSHEEAAAIRTVEAKKACSILKARPVFAGQIDGRTEINMERYDQFQEILEGEKPDIVFTHWPLDTHRDHRTTSLLVYDAWMKSGQTYPLFYFEVDAGAQTSHFWPTHFVDITGTESRKRAACYMHVSQNPDSFYLRYHDLMHRFRGLEAGRKLAEGFVRHVQNPDESLPLAL
jgi:LmbE family N-acetylglucosaminyl deacetylase